MGRLIISLKHKNVSRGTLNSYNVEGLLLQVGLAGGDMRTIRVARSTPGSQRE